MWVVVVGIWDFDKLEQLGLTESGRRHVERVTHPPETTYLNAAGVETLKAEPVMMKFCGAHTAVATNRHNESELSELFQSTYFMYETNKIHNFS